MNLNNHTKRGQNFLCKRSLKFPYKEDYVLLWNMNYYLNKKSQQIIQA